MNLSELDQALRKIIVLRNELAQIDYNNPKYDALEEQLHDLEDDFQEDYGEYLEDLIQQAHDQIVSDTDVLHPIAYVAKTYEVVGDEFKVASSAGVFVEIDKMPGKDTKLVLLPNPVRVVLNVGGNQEVVVTAQ